MITGEQIKASEVQLTGLNGEDLGIVPRKEALAMAKELGVDLVCTSLLSSPPPCRLISRSEAKEELQQARRSARAGSTPPKVKEIRLTPETQEHDYDTKCRQAQKLLESGCAVQLQVKAQGKQQAAQAKAVVERLLQDLAVSGRPETGIQVSGKGAQVKLLPRS